MLTLLADADVFAYKFAAANQEQTEWEPGCFNLVSNGPEACTQMDAKIESLMNQLKADRIIMVLSDSENFRKKILPTYKANRNGILRPLCLKFVRDYISKNYETKQKPGLEGDDVIGILATHPTLVKGEKLIVSIDKDFKTIPGRMYNPDTDEFTSVTEEEANYFHMLQTLMGDACDNYSGCPGIGPKKAANALAAGKHDGHTYWATVVEYFEAAGLTEDDALVQARCARILRYTDYDFEKKEPILWNPNS
jgi:DNA polymerase I